MGTAVTGTFLFDTSIADSNINSSSFGSYLHSGNGGFNANFQALNGGNPVAVAIGGSGSPEVRVEWFPDFNDTWRYWDGPDNPPMTVNGVPNADVLLRYSMTQAVLFSSDANVNPWPLTTFTGNLGDTSHTFELRDSNGSILLQINNAVTIPEPASGTIALSALLCCWLARRRLRRGN
jgi:hypothetical protein